MSYAVIFDDLLGRRRWCDYPLFYEAQLAVQELAGRHGTTGVALVELSPFKVLLSFGTLRT